MGRLERKYTRIESDKELLRKWNRERELGNMISGLGWKELDKPQRDGYEKRYILRLDYRIRKGSHFFQTLLDLTNTTIYSHDKNFLAKNWKTGKMVPQKHPLKIVNEEDYDQLTDKQQSHFSEKWRFHSWHNEYVLVGYTMGQPFWLVTKIYPSYIYRTKITDNELEKEKDQINHYFQRTNAYARLGKLLGWKNHRYDSYWRPRAKVLARENMKLFKEEKKQIIREFNNISEEENGI